MLFVYVGNEFWGKVEILHQNEWTYKLSNVPFEFKNGQRIVINLHSNNEDFCQITPGEHEDQSEEDASAYQSDVGFEIIKFVSNIKHADFRI